MSATGKTPNFQIPIYNAGDTANYLTSYNNGMSIIDTQMETNRAAAAAAQSAVNTLEKTVNNQAEQIAEVKQTADSGKITWYTLTIQSENCTAQNSPACGATSDIIFIHGRWNFMKEKQNIPNTITNGSEVWAPFAYISGNPAGLSEGIANRINNLTGCRVYTDTGNNQYGPNVNVGMWVVGGNTYFGVLVIGFSASETVNNAYVETFFKIP